MASKRFTLNLDLTAVIVIIAAGVLLPVMLSTAAGIVALVFAEHAAGIVTGVLIISFTVTAAGGALVAVVLASRKARLAKRQADFVANVSHEFRTPLSSIKLYTQTLQSDDLRDAPDRRAECLATILRETERLDMMLDRVLAWRASSRNMLSLRMEPASVTAAVDDACSRFRSLLERGNARLTVSSASDLVVLHDPSAIGAVVLNLLTNAFKYSGDDKAIAVAATDGADEVCITVSDNGPGLSPKEQKHIFKPFYRGRSNEQSGAAGVGLGLAIARYLVRRHHGRITVNSRKGHGTTFTILLPVAPQQP